MAGILDLFFPNNEGAPQASPVDYTQAQGILNQQAQQPILAQQPPANQPPAMPQDNKWIKALDIVGQGLMAAGSPNPSQTMLEFARARKIDEEAKKPKVTPLADGAFSLIAYPDGTTKIVKNDDVAKYVQDSKQLSMEQALQKILFGKKTDAELAATKDDIKNSGDARKGAEATNGLIAGWKKAYDIVSNQANNSPTMSKVQGALPGISGFFGGDEVASNKFLQGLTVDETLLNTARTKGAISDAEMALFKSPLPSPSDDREKVWKPFIEQRLPILQRIAKFQEEEAARANDPASRITGGQSAGPNVVAPKAFTVPGLSEGASKYFK